MCSWKRLLVGFALFFCSLVGTTAQGDHIRPHFVDYLDADTLANVYAAAGQNYVNALEAGLALPLITPPNHYEFAVNLGEEHTFFVVGQWSDGDSPVGTGLSLGVLFEEPASLFAGDPECQSTPRAERACVKLDGFDDWCACEALQTELPDGRLANKVFTDAFPNDNRRFGKYTFTARRWRPRSELRVCFRVLDCNPAAAQDDEQACEQAGPDGGLDPRFYPQRCVFVTVLQPPAIQAVHPLDPTHRVEGSEVVTVPEHPWYHNATTVDVALREGELLQLAVDAWDVNEGDDVDVRLADASAPLPPGAALGPRMCCEEGWEDCEERPAGAQHCEDECHVSCEHVSILNNSVSAECQQLCTPRCTPLPCRYVRRVVVYLGAATSVSGLQFEAFDNSQRLTNSLQVSSDAYPAPPRCCNASSLVSSPSAPVALAVRAAPTAIAFPSPIHESVVRVRAGCAAPAVGVFALSADTIDLLPDGCQPNTVVRSQVCVEEACSARSDCCCATPPHVCPLCLPTTPPGMDLSGPMHYALLPRPLPPVAPAAVSSSQLLGASAEKTLTDAGHTAYVLRMRFNMPIPPDTRLLLSGLRQANASVPLQTPWPQTVQDIEVVALGDEETVTVDAWEPEAGAMHLRLHRSRPMLSREVHVQWRVDPMLELNTSAVTVSLDGADVDASHWLRVDTPPAPFTGCHNCSVPGLLGAGSAEGTGVGRVVRWRPGVEEMGRRYAVCFTALGANLSDAARAAAPHHCIHYQVERCQYCVQGGETLSSIALALGTDWLQLWSANAMAGVGADGVSAGAVLRVGPVHRVQATAKLEMLAVQLGTTEASLRQMNRDIPPEQMWVSEDRELCVLPGVCNSHVAPDGSGLQAAPAMTPDMPA